MLDDVVAMEDALPDKAPATPKKPRKVLVLAQAVVMVHRLPPPAVYHQVMSALELRCSSP